MEPGEKRMDIFPSKADTGYQYRLRFILFFKFSVLN